MTRTWHHATVRARIYTAGLVFAVAEAGAIGGLPRPIALAVFAAGLAIAAAAIRPATRGSRP